jgi:hypothetical protein
MTTLTERTAPAVANPRDLVSPELFGKLVDRVMRDEQVTEGYAERVIDQTLVFLIACAGNGSGLKLSPSTPVDPGWHAFVLHTEDYAEFCQRVAGRFIHHRPIMDTDIRSGAALERTVIAMHATGYPVDADLWSGATSCGSGCEPR